MTAREKSLLLHGTRDIDAAGDEVEQTARRVLKRKLASRYYVGHGHTLDQSLTTSPQLDIIIADNSGAPVLFMSENGTEYFPFESVYAIGEVKSAYYKHKNYLEHFSDTLIKIKTELKREQTPHTYLGSNVSLSSEDFIMESAMPYRNPFFSFILIVEGNDFNTNDAQAFYQSKTAYELPNIVCILNKGIIVNMKYKVEQGRIISFSISVTPEFNKQSDVEHSQWVFIPWEQDANCAGLSFGYLIYLLSSHLRTCTLMPPNLFPYMNNLFAGVHRAIPLT